MVQWVKNLNGPAWVIAEVWVDPWQWVKGSSVATAEAQMAGMVLIQSLAWELSYTTGVTLKKKTNNLFVTTGVYA